MTPIQLPPVVQSLVLDPGTRVRRADDGVGLDVGDSESRFIARLEGDTYRVDEIQRGEFRRTVLLTTEDAAVVRYLALVIGASSRDFLGLPALPPTAGMALPDGTSLEKVGPRRYTLRWAHDGVERRADDMIEYEAVNLARTLVFPLDVVVAALREPTGAPVFI